MVVMDLLHRYKDLSVDDKESLYNYKQPHCIKDMLYLSVDMETNAIEYSIKKRIKDENNKTEHFVTNEELMVREGYEVIHRGYHNSESFLGMVFVAKMNSKLDLTSNDLLTTFSESLTFKKSEKFIDLFQKQVLDYSKNRSNAYLKIVPKTEKKEIDIAYNEFIATNFPEHLEYLSSQKRNDMITALSDYLTSSGDYLLESIRTIVNDNNIDVKSDFGTRLILNFKGFEDLLVSEEDLFKLKRVFDSAYTGYILIGEDWYFVPDSISSLIRKTYNTVNRNNILFTTGLIHLSDLNDYYELSKYKNHLYNSYIGPFKNEREVYLDKVTLIQKQVPSIGDYKVVLYDSNKGSIDFYSTNSHTGDIKLNLISYYEKQEDSLVLTDIDSNSYNFVKLIANNFIDSITYSGKENKENKYLDFKKVSKPSSKLNSLFLRDGKFIIDNLESFGFESIIIKKRLLKLMNDSINAQCLEVRKEYSLFNKLLLKLSIESQILGVDNKVVTLENKKNDLIGRLSEDDFKITDLDEYSMLAGSVLRYILSFTSKQDSDKAIYISNLSKKKSVKDINKYLSDLDGRFHVTLKPSKNYKKARIAMMNFEDVNVSCLDPLWYALYIKNNIISKPKVEQSDSELIIK